MGVYTPGYQGEEHTRENREADKILGTNTGLI
jgi:hypothetical protein